jgi:copper transport protein
VKRDSGRRRTIALAVLLAAILGLGSMTPGVALAHAFLVRGTPVPDSILQGAPVQVHLYFSEDLNGSASLIIVWDRYRHNEAIGHAQLVPGQSRQLEVGLKPLTPGSYLVLWTSVSSLDGHILHGAYSFGVQHRGPLPSLVGVSFGGTSQGFPDGSTLASIIVHWLELLGPVAWFGGVFFSAFVLSVFEPRMEPAIVRAEERGLLWYVRSALAMTFLASMASLTLQAHALAGAWSSAFTGTTLGSLFSAQFGKLWVVRQGLVLLALLYTAGPVRRALIWHLQSVGRQAEPPLSASLDRIGIRTRPAATDSGATSGTVARAVELRSWNLWPALSAVVGLAYLYFQSASGHAASALIWPVLGSRVLSVSVLNDWMHSIGAALWLGGQIYIVTVLAPALRVKRELGPHSGVFMAALNRFSPVAYASIAFFTLSGGFNGKTLIPSWYAFFHSVYGWTLVVKMALIGCMMLVSVVTVYGLRPRIRRALVEVREDIRLGSGILMDSLVRWLRAGPVLGAGVLLATSVMYYYPVPAGLAPPPPSSYTVRAGGLEAIVSVKPARAGPNTFTVRLLNAAGKPVQGAHVVILTTMLDMVMGTGLVNLTPSSPGTFTGSGDLGMGGHWRFQVLVYAAGGLTRLNVDGTVGT